MAKHSSIRVAPPSAQAIETALRILLESVETESARLRHPNQSPPDGQLQVLQMQREALRKAHVILSREARTRMARLGKQRNRLIHINKLPFELMADILLRSLSPADHQDLQRLYDLSLVNTTWWHIIKNHAPFWTVIHAGDYGVVERKLERSRSLPLDVFCLSGGDYDYQDLEGCMNLLAGHRHRIRTFMSHCEHMDLIEEFLVASTPLLETVTLETPSGCHGDGVALVGGPRLCRIQLRGVTWHVGGFTEIVQLRTLNMVRCLISGPDIKSFMEVLGTCLQLEELVLDRIEGSDTHQLPIEPVSLPNLHSLTLTEVIPTVAITLLTFVHADSLKYLCVDYLEEVEEHADEVATGILTSSSPPPCLVTMLADPQFPDQHLTITIEDMSLKVEGDTEKRHGADAIRLAFMPPRNSHWLHDLAEMGPTSLSNCGVPILVVILDSIGWDQETAFPIDLSPFAGMTMLRLSCGPRLALRVVRSLCRITGRDGGLGPWSCPRLSGLYLDNGGRDDWECEGWRWEALVEALTSLSAERASTEAGVTRLTIYKYRWIVESEIVEDFASLYPAGETESDEDSGSDSGASIE